MSDPMTFTDGRLGGAAATAGRGDAPLAAVPERTILDDLADDIAEAVNLPEVTYVLPHRAGYEIVVDPNIPYETYDAWTKRCVDRKGATDEMRLALTVIAAQTVRIVRHGTPVLLDGQPIRFGDETLWRTLKVGGALEAVSKLVGNDGDISAISVAIIREAGYLRSVEGEVRSDPTQG